MNETPTLEQRLDAAAEAVMSIVNGKVPTELKSLSGDDKAQALWICNVVCRAFAPEHFKDTDKE